MKKKEARINLKLILIGISLVSIISFILIASALTSQDEISQLEQEISSAGYSWLVDYVRNAQQGISEHKKIVRFSVPKNHRFSWHPKNLMNEQEGFFDNLTYPSAEVYRQDDNDVLAVFNNLNEGMNKIFLANLGENESYDVFDLKSVGNVGGGGSCNEGVRVPYDVYLKKMRIDEIRKELNWKGENV